MTTKTTATKRDAGDAIRIVPANEASWDDLRAVFGERGEPARCQCQWFQTAAAECRALPVEERAWRPRRSASPGNAAPMRLRVTR